MGIGHWSSGIIGIRKSLLHPSFNSTNSTNSINSINPLPLAFYPLPFLSCLLFSLYTRYSSLATAFSTHQLIHISRFTPHASRSFFLFLLLISHFYSGIFPCFLGGNLSCLFSSIFNAHIIFFLVSFGSITSSRYP